MGKVLAFSLQAKRSYVFSVSLGTGCYRHIRVDGRETLEMLSSYILQAFDFVEDHAHAFFMDNKAWSDMDCYYMDLAADGDCRHTCDYKLMDLQVATYIKIPSISTHSSNHLYPSGSKSLEVGHKFKYVFDFGDDWRFDCKVLKIIDEETEIAHIVRSKGEPPLQYNDFECDDFE